MSQFFGALQIAGLNKLGNAYVPGDEDLPSFSQLGCAEAVDQVLEHIPPGDRGDLKLLMTFLGLAPSLFHAFLVRFLEWAPHWPGFLGGSLLRFMQLGLKGLVMTLYWSGNKGKNFSGRGPLEFLDYKVSVHSD